QVRETITSLFDQRMSIQSLQPSNKEITDALGSGVTQLALKFSGGALFVGVAALTLIAYARRRRPTARQVVSVGVAGLLAIGGAGIGIAGTYQPYQLTSFNTTGLLGTVRSNPGRRARGEPRAGEPTPAVPSLLPLRRASQGNFPPADIPRPRAARFLLVSD